MVVLRLTLRVWFNGRTSASQAEDAGSIPVTRSLGMFATNTPNDSPLRSQGSTFERKVDGILAKGEGGTHLKTPNQS